MAVRLAELEGASPAVLPEPEAVSRRTAEPVADLVEPARADTLEKLDEGRRSFGIANAWVRTKLIRDRGLAATITLTPPV